MIVKTIRLKSKICGNRIFEPGETVYIETEFISTKGYILCGNDGVRFYAASFELDFETVQEVKIEKLPATTKGLPHGFPLLQARVKRCGEELTVQNIIATAQNQL
jgi:hypothetical protein